MTRVALLFVLLIPGLTWADEKLKGIACRSVHLAYPGPESLAFYTEMKVEKSAPGTYFMACGFNMGYFGIQELANGKKLVIFSVWDPGKQNDPNKVETEQRVKLLHQGDSVRVGRFGNEGTGGQSFFDYDWKIGTNYRFVVTAKPDGKRTAYAGHFWLPEKKEWKHLITFSTITGGKPLSGYYSFIEDFRRNKVSTTLNRRATFGNGFLISAKGEAIPLNQARFTADANPVLNIDAGVVDDRFFLATGGDITNANTRLRDKMIIPAQNVPDELQPFLLKEK